jgi:hypothetical protein
MMQLRLLPIQEPAGAVVIPLEILSPGGIEVYLVKKVFDGI